MASDSSRSGRPGVGKPAGRGHADTPSARTASRPNQRSGQTKSKQGAADSTPKQSGEGRSTNVPRWRHGLRITQRAIILGVVLVVLLVSYATTLRVYLNQQFQIAKARQQVAEHEQAIRDLEDEIERWQDPAYVQIQARERLGWVVPGETGFRVIGPDGAPYGGGTRIGAAQLPQGEYAKTWWDRMWGSVAVADDPVPIDEPAGNEPIRPADPADGP